MRKLIENNEIFNKILDCVDSNININPYFVNLEGLSDYVLLFNIYKNKNGLGGISRKSGLTALLSSNLNILSSEADYLIELRNLLSHAFDTKKIQYKDGEALDMYEYIEDELCSDVKSLTLTVKTIILDILSNI